MKAASPHRISLRDVALAAGVSHPTVSRALTGDPRVKAETRKKIKALAEKMGYRPDPALAALAAYRTAKTRPANHGRLAYLHPWGDIPGYDNYAIKVYLPALRKHAEQLGYTVEVFTFYPSAEEQRKLSRILYSQGVTGLFVGEMPPKHSTLDHINWSRFAGVALDTSLKSPWLPYVSDANPKRADVTYRKLREAGYKKIGFVNRTSIEDITDNLFLATYLKCLYLDGLSPEEHPPYFYRTWREIDVVPWLERHGFDAVMTTLPYEFIRNLRKSEYRVPENLGLGSLYIRQEDPNYDDFAGCMVDWNLWGEVAMDLMHKRLCHGERGASKLRTEIFFDIPWRDGKSAHKPKR